MKTNEHMYWRFQTGGQVAPLGPNDIEEGPWQIVNQDLACCGAGKEVMCKPLCSVTR